MIELAPQRNRSLMEKVKEFKASPSLNSLFPLCYHLPLTDGRSGAPPLLSLHLHETMFLLLVHCLPHQCCCELLKVSDYLLCISASPGYLLPHIIAAQ